MRTQITSYLTFQGNCREAMTFYQTCFGGELIFHTLGESPMANSIPEDLKKYILNSTLINDKLVLAGSDMVPDSGLSKGNAVSLLLNCSSEQEVNRYFSKLSADGCETHPLAYTFWGALFGSLVDKYGHHWLLRYDAPRIDEWNEIRKP